MPSLASGSSVTRLQWSGASGAVPHPEILFSMALERALAFTGYAKALASCAMEKRGLRIEDAGMRANVNMTKLQFPEAYARQ